MKFKPILFSTDMVRAILDNRKTQTRRAIKLPKDFNVLNIDFPESCKLNQYGILGAPKNVDFTDENLVYIYRNMPYQTGEIMWVRETWQDTDFIHWQGDEFGYYYRASKDGQEWEKNHENWKWKPSIFLPKAGARIFLKVTNVRIERVQDISEADAIGEGVEYLFPVEDMLHDSSDWKNYTWHGMGGDDSFTGYSNTNSAKESFQSLWYAINGKASWEENPWCFVYDFEKVWKGDLEGWEEYCK